MQLCCSPREEELVVIIGAVWLEMLDPNYRADWLLDPIKDSDMGANCFPTFSIGNVRGGCDRTPTSSLLCASQHGHRGRKSLCNRIF